MRYRFRLSLVTVMAAVLAAACGDLPHESPFDPLTPQDKQARAELTGRFTLEGETDHAGIEVRLDGPVKTDISTQSDGSFAVNQLIPGAYTLTIGERGWQEVTRAVEIDAGAVAALAAEELPLRKGAVAGTIAAADGADVKFQGATFTLTRVASLRANAPAAAPAGFTPALELKLVSKERLIEIDSDNTFFVDELATGEWEIRAQEPFPGTDTCGEYRDSFLTEACRKAREEAEYRMLHGDHSPAEPRLAPAVLATIKVTGDDAVVQAPALKVPVLSGDLELRGFLAGGLESAQYTATPSIRLRLTGANAVKMLLGQGGIDGSCVYGDVVDFEVAPAVELAAGDGTKTVCALLVNEDATQTVLLRGAIVLDMTPPVLNVVRVNGGGAFSTVATLPLELIAYDNGAGLDKIARLRNGADLGTIDYVPFFSDTVTADGAYAYSLQVRDRAGHASAAVTATVTVDRTAPTGLGVTVNGGVAQTSNRLLQLAIVPGDATELQISLDNAFGGVAWQAATTATQLYVSRADGTITVYVRGRDGAGNVSEVVSDGITLDTTPPDAVAIALADTDGDGYPLTHERAELTWSASVDPSAVGYELQRYVIGASSAFEPVTTVAAGVETYADDISATAGKVHQYRVRVLDTLGQASQWSNVLAVNTMAADGQVCWIVNQATGADVAYTLVPPTGAVGSQVTSRFVDMAANDAVVVQTYPENSLTYSQARRALDASAAQFTVASKNLDGTYRQEGTVDMPMGWHGQTIDTTTTLFVGKRVVVDGAGDVHLVYIDADGLTLRYAGRVGGVWQAPMTIVPASGAMEIDAALDGQDRLHVVFVDIAGGKLREVVRGPGGWSSAADLASGTLGSYSRLAAGRDGELYAAYLSSSTLQVLRTTAGIWGAPAPVTTAGAINERIFGLGVDSHGAVHLSYQGTDKLFRYVNDVGGDWNAAEFPEGMFPFTYGGERSELYVDPNDKIHILEYNGDPFGGAAKHHWTNASGAWQQVSIEPSWNSIATSIPAAFDPDATLHVIDVNDSWQLLYRTRAAGGAWTANTIINPSQAAGQFIDVFADRDRSVHLLYGGNKELRYLTNAGSTTSAFIPLMSGNAHAVPMAVDSTGAVHAVYADWQTLYYHKKGDGAWGPRIELQGTSEFAAFAALAVDPADQVHVVYPSYSTQALRYTYWNGATWSAPVSLDPAIGYSAEAPAAAAGKDGAVHIVYYDDLSDDLRYVTGTPGSWSAPVTLDAAGDTGHDLNVAVDAAGSVHVAYFDVTTGNVKYLRRTGTTWSAPAVVAPGHHQYARHPVSLAVDSRGVAHVAFLGANDYSVRYANNAQGVFGTPVVLDTLSGGGTSLAVDSHDRVHLFYFGEAMVKYTFYSGRRWVSPVVVKSGLADFYGDSGGFPAIAVDAHDRLHLSVFNGAGFRTEYKAVRGEAGCATFGDLVPVSPF